MKYLWIALCIIALAACGQAVSNQQTTPVSLTAVADTSAEAKSAKTVPESTNPAHNAIHLVIDASRDATYKRKGWKHEQSIHFGTVLYTGDIIERSASGKVVIICADLTMPAVSSEPAGVPCSDDHAVLTDRGSELASVRGEATLVPLLLLAPLPGAIREGRPQISWVPVGATTAYTVTLSDDDGEVWNLHVPRDTTSIPFPAEKNALAKGKRYTLVVTADGGISSERAPGRHKIHLIEPQQRQMLEAQERQVRGFAISDTAKQLLLAQLLLNYNLISEAQAQLMAVAKIAPEATTYFRLAETEASGLLYEQAIEHYKQAFTLATGQDDTEIAALASWELGRIYLYGLANPTLARNNLKQARDLYVDLLVDSKGSDVIEQIDKDLGMLSAP